MIYPSLVYCSFYNDVKEIVFSLSFEGVLSGLINLAAYLYLAAPKPASNVLLIPLFNLGYLVFEDPKD